MTGFSEEIEARNSELADLRAQQDDANRELEEKKAALTRAQQVLEAARTEIDLAYNKAARINGQVVQKERSLRDLQNNAEGKQSV